MVKTYIVVLSLLLFGCGPSSECTAGEARCEGSIAYFCGMHSEDHSDVYVWNVSECGKDSPFQYDKYCVVVDFSSGSQGAFCVHSQMTYEQCNSMKLGEAFCVDGKQLNCSSKGYATSRGRTCSQ